MICKDNTQWTPSDEDVANWNKAYGSKCNVANELQKMDAWLNCNPTKRKTPNGMRRFVNSWLSRAAEKGGSPALTQSEVATMKIDGFEESVRDALFAKLQEVMAFYGKEVNRSDLKIWCKALVNQKLPDIEEALDRCILNGRYAPRPVDVMEQINKVKQYNNDVAPKAIVQATWNPAPANVQKAWMWYIAKFRTGGMTEGMFSSALRNTTPEQEEEYLLTVNQEAFRANSPEAINDEHKFVEIWGEREYV